MASTFTALNPEGYEKIMGRFSRRLAHAFIDFTGSAAGETILDVGCGTGSMTAALAEPGSHAAIVGIDRSEPYVAFARAPGGGGSSGPLPRVQGAVAQRAMRRIGPVAIEDGSVPGAGL